MNFLITVKREASKGSSRFEPEELEGEAIPKIDRTLCGLECLTQDLIATLCISLNLVSIWSAKSGAFNIEVSPLLATSKDMRVLKVHKGKIFLINQVVSL